MVDTIRDPSAYLQQRVVLFSSVACPFFGVLCIVDLIAPSAEGEALLSSTRVAWLTVSVTFGLIWLFLRRGERPAWQSRGLELGGMAVSASVLATLPLFPPVPGAGGVMGMLVAIPMAIVVLMRAAIIPSPGWLSALVALVWGTVMTAASVLGFEGLSLHLPGQAEHDPRILPFVQNAFATVGLAIEAGIVSRVVHGLQTQVREAMQLGQYTLESKLGEGGMGAVYRARHAMLRRPTAVKLLPPDKAGEQAIRRFEREVQQTSRLTHPNTVAIFDYGRTEDGVFYYAMEYLDGISLEDLVARFGPQSEGRTIHLLRQVADALSEAHGMGLVHRDIKPDNILLCERGAVPDVVKVVDFGLVKDVATSDDPNLTTTDTVQGTPLYLAPEALTDPDAIDPRADLYALGAVAYYLLTGETLFEGNVVEVLGHHLHTRPTPPSERLGSAIDPKLEAIVLRCLAKKPSDRFGSAAELGDALAECAAASAWTRLDGRDWWAAHRGTLEPHPERMETSRTIAPA